MLPLYIFSNQFHTSPTLDNLDPCDITYSKKHRPQSTNSRHYVYCHPTLCIIKSRWFPVQKDQMTLSTWVVLHTRCSVDLLSASAKINFYQGQPTPSLLERPDNCCSVDLLFMWMPLISSKDSQHPPLRQMAMIVNGL